MVTPAKQTRTNGPVDKADAFRRMAEARVTKAAHAVRLVGNLTNKRYYDYTPQDIEAVMLALKLAVQDVESRFRKTAPQEPFRLRR